MTAAMMRSEATAQPTTNGSMNPASDYVTIGVNPQYTNARTPRNNARTRIGVRI